MADQMNWRRPPQATAIGLRKYSTRTPSDKFGKKIWRRLNICYDCIYDIIYFMKQSEIISIQLAK